MSKKFKTFSLTVTGSILLLCLILLVSCSENENSGQKTATAEKAKSMIEKEAGPLENKGIGPISEVVFSEEIDHEMVSKGKILYEEKCIACHNLESDLIGPSQAGVLKRRSPEWVMNLMLNPEEMLKKDPIAKKLLVQYNNVPMTDQQLKEEEARAILEFFRTI